MPVECAISLDNLRTVPRSLLTEPITRLDAARIDQIRLLRAGRRTEAIIRAGRAFRAACRSPARPKCPASAWSESQERQASHSEPCQQGREMFA